MQEGGHHGGSAPDGRTPARGDATATSRDVAPGIAAIAKRLAQAYGHTEVHAHWEAENSMRDGGDDPLEGVSAFTTEGHFHYVSYGLSELWDNDTRGFRRAPGASGFGFELSFRLACGDDKEAPSWPVGMMQRLARYVFRSGNVFRPGDHMDLNGPMGGQNNSRLTGALFTHDPTLGTIDSRFGTVSFLQVVGVTDDELEAVKDWRCEGFLEVLSRQDRLLISDAKRDSHLLDPQFRAICREGTRQEGSSHGSSFASVVGWEAHGEGEMVIRVGAIAVRDLLRMLTLRLPFNRPFRLHGKEASVHFVPGLGAGWQPSENDLVVSVPWDAAATMANVLKPVRGHYSWSGMPGLTLTVEPTEVRGSSGELVRVIG